jgi:peptidoglycan hydrolase-like protein with peptidoglycan-binding domain
MKSLRTLINLFEEEIDPTKVVMDNDPIDPSKVVMDKDNNNKDKDKEKKRQWNPGVLGTGVSGQEVKELQGKLIAAGLLPQGSDDGQFGKNTRDAVIKLQQALGVKADGAVGPVTKKALDAKYQDLIKQKPDQQPAPTDKKVDQQPAPTGLTQADVDKRYGELKNLDAVKALVKPAGSSGYYIDDKTGQVMYKWAGDDSKPSPVWNGGQGGWRDTGGFSTQGSEPNRIKQALDAAGIPYTASGPNSGVTVDLTKINQPQAPAQQPEKQSQNAPANGGAGFNPITKEPTKESVGFQNDELTRLVSLVHYR